MTNLLLSSVTLFVLAVLLGAAAGFTLRAITTASPRKDVDEEIVRLGNAVRQARQRSEPAA